MVPGSSASQFTSGRGRSLSTSSKRGQCHGCANGSAGQGKRGSPCEQASTVAGDTLSLVPARLPVRLPQILHHADRVQWRSPASHILEVTIFCTLAMSIQYRHRGLANCTCRQISDRHTGMPRGQKDRQGRHTCTHMRLHMQYFSHCTMMMPGLSIDKIHGRGAKQACPTDSRTGAAGAWIEEVTTLLDCHDAGVEGKRGERMRPCACEPGLCMVQLTLSPSIDSALGLRSCIRATRLVAYYAVIIRQVPW